MTSKSAMQSAVSQWETLRKIQEAAREVLPEEECRVLDEKSKDAAFRTLHLLNQARDQRQKTPTPAPDLEDEPTETRLVREVLTKTTGD
jgi:hypothetical protein